MSVPLSTVTATEEYMYSDNNLECNPTRASTNTGTTYTKNNMGWGFKLFRDADTRTSEIQICASGTENNKGSSY